MQGERSGSRGEQVAGIGLRIRQLRQERGLTQRDLERTTGLDMRYVSRVERGAMLPSLKNVEKLAAALKVPLYQLFCTDIPSAPAPRLNSGETQQLDKNGAGAASQARFLPKLMSLNARLGDAERAILLDLAALLAARPDSRS